MFVTKRNGNEEEVQFDKITERISKLIKPDESKYINAILVGQKVVAYIHTGITTEELDIVSADRCINLSTTHPLYSNLGSAAVTPVQCSGQPPAPIGCQSSGPFARLELTAVLTLRKSSTSLAIGCMTFAAPIPASPNQSGQCSGARITGSL